MRSINLEKNYFRKGYITLYGVIIICAIGLVISLNLISMGTNSLKTGVVVSDNTQTKAIVNGCTEIALLRLRHQAVSYEGGETHYIGQGSCYIHPVIRDDTTMIINVEGGTGNLTRKVQITLTQLQLGLWKSVWEEVEEF